jgi:uncharacterized protein (TIGR02466 family)|tara:strand:- start:322 stop:960 length:639 start_codon:yes stop_codon:yes gene_type:complete
MSFQRLPILPTELYEFEYPKNLVEEAIETIITHKITDGYGRYKGKKEYGESSPGSKSLHKNPYFAEHTRYIEECLKEVTTDLEYNNNINLKVCLFWANRSRPGQWHHAHRHPWSFLSGIIYLQGNSGRTWFSRENPYDFSNQFPAYYESERENIIHKHTPTPGKMIIFPSNLIHSVDNNMENEDRITLSFNTFPTGTVGEKSNLSGFDLQII